MPSEENKETVAPTKQGDVGLLREPIAQQLLQSKSPAHLAYTWRDGTPRVVPIGFHWNGQEIVLATATDAPKTKVLKNGSKVAVSIDHDSSPPQDPPHSGDGAHRHGRGHCPGVRCNDPSDNERGGRAGIAHWGDPPLSSHDAHLHSSRLGRDSGL